MMHSYSVNHFALWETMIVDREGREGMEAIPWNPGEAILRQLGDLKRRGFGRSGSRGSIVRILTNFCSCVDYTVWVGRKAQAG